MTLRYDPPWKVTEGVLATYEQKPKKDNGNRLRPLVAAQHLTRV